MSIKDQGVIVDIGIIVKNAFNFRASDIHFISSKHGATLFFRVDGLLVFQYNILKQEYIELVARIKILSKIKLDEHFLPQDGRYSDIITNIDLRVSLAPTRFGFSVVMRLVRGNFTSSLADLGFSSDQVLLCKEIINKPHGMILITGPTGSGKTTTLYSLLSLIDTKTKALITIEDPVEYDIEYATQIQVNERAGLTFNTGLRSIVRQDPDIIVVGEIRDEITAKIATHAALTGHQVFSTLHTSGSIQTIMRLTEMNIQPYVVGSAINMIISQKLVSLLCKKCFGSSKKGCSICLGKGVYKRTVVAEILIMTEEIKKMISSKALEHQIKKQAEKDGFKPIKNHIESKVLENIIGKHELFL